jgi:flagellar biosynthesis protein FlhG
VAKARFVSLLSGKGGVGKSVLAFNLADQLAGLGYRVLLVDADFALGSLHVLANLNVSFGLNEYVAGTRSLAECVVSARGVDVLASTWNHELAEARSIEQTARFIEKLRGDSGVYDFVILDHGSGRSNQAVLMAHGSDLNLLVLVPELTSLADAYGLFKQIITANENIACALLINRCLSGEEAEFIRTRMSEMTRQFLQVVIGYVGFVPEDGAIRHSVAQQQPLALAAPESPACKQAGSIANTIASFDSRPLPASREAFLKQINKTPATADIRG